MNVLKSFKISSQVMLIGIVALMGFSLIAAVYLTSSATLEHIQDEQEFEVEGQKLINDINYGFMNARRWEKDFLLRFDEKYVGRHDGETKHILDNLEALHGYHSVGFDGAVIDAVQAGVREYRNQFTIVADKWTRIGLTPKSGLRGSLRASVHDLETELKDLDHEGLMSTMLMMRRHEKDFMMRLDPKYVDAMDRREQEFSTLMQSSGMSAATGERLRGYLLAYVAEFRKLAGTRLQLKEDVSRLSILFAKTEPQIETLMHDSDQVLLATAAKSHEKAGQARMMMIGAMAGTALLVFLMCLLIGRGFSKPIREMVGAMTDLAGGNKEITIPAEDFRNEIGDMASAIAIFRENALHMEKLEEDRKLAQKAAELEKAVWMAQMADDFDERVGGVIEAVSEATSQVQNQAESVSASASQTSSQATTVASAAEEASCNVQTVATAAEELSASVMEIDRQVQEASRVVVDAVGEVRHSRETVSKLAETAEKIDAVVVMISEIADQTNLLALNATIEAARAGDSGKGFAVVASEVKALAKQTSHATEEISSQVRSIQQYSVDAVASIKEISGTIENVSDISNAIAAAVQEQTATTREIARNTQQAAVGTERVSGVITDVTMAAGHSGDASSQMLQASDDLSQQSSILRTEVDKFLDEVRTS